MRSRQGIGRPAAWVPLVAVVVGLSGCKAFTERYIALEVWKYEKCFGHLPPGFVPPGAAAAGPRVCGQAAPCQQACPPAQESCDGCQGAAMESAPGLPAGAVAPSGPGGSPPAGSAAMRSSAGITTGKPVIISDEVVIP